MSIKPTAHARARAKRGQPTVWTSDVEKLFFQAVGSGSSLKDACRFAGIHFDTLMSRRVKEPAFGDRVEKALNDVKIGLLAQQMIHSRKHHGATEWLLERRWPEEFGRRTTHEVSGGETPIKVELDVDAEIADKLRSSPAGHAIIWDAIYHAASSNGAPKPVR